MQADIESYPILIQVHHGVVEGDLNVPAGSTATVVFAHGSGSSRHSPRNQHVAEVLNRSGLATLLMDLLTTHEEVIDRRTAHLRFDIDLLADRLVAATDWLRGRSGQESRHIGYFGASTGAAAALVAAAKRPEVVEAVVSRGGRPDLAGSSLPAVQAPTLLIVGEFDDVVLDLNRRAAELMFCEQRIEIVPRASHLFEEQGALEQVAYQARLWFEDHMLKDRLSAA
jgi:pimeloyl-ACP methyl ester carboxylesterase